MKLIDLLKKANTAYADGFLVNYYDETTGEKKKGDGDGLAKFIVGEIIETYDAAVGDHDQIQVARHALLNGIQDLQGVVDALDELQR